MTPFVLTALAVLCLTVLAFFFGGDAIIDRLTIALVVGTYSASAAIVGWGIYIISHFVSRYW